MPRSLRGYVFALLLAPGAAPVRAADAPDFNRDVRPILAARCFKCHGPDDASRKAGLRLDTADGAKEAIGTAQDSEFLRRIETTDADAIMPPPSAKIPLTPKERDTLKAWITSGATYAPHWAFVNPTRPAVAKLKDQPANPIDAFVRARLQREGLAPAPEADRHALIRRVYLDLIGVPPAPDEADTFAADKSPDAYEKVVDRLLASPLYGERWARKWLDLARYADTNGYEKDRRRSIWPYRDWLIRALNADLPFDQFTVDQLAGDMLPNATPEQKIATGFHRNTMLNEEGGIDPLEFRYHAIADRTAVTGTVWLGLTIGCAQCHTHKFDPVTHTEYFRFFALLNNTDEPDFTVPSAESAKRRRELEAAIQRLEAALPDKLPAEKRDAAFAAWLGAERKRAVKWTIVTPTKMDAGPTKLTSQPDGSVFASGDAQKRDLYTLALEGLPAGVTAVRIEALPDERLPAGGPGRAYYEGPKGDFLLSEFTLSVEGKPVRVGGASESHARGNLNAKAALDGHPFTGWGGSGVAGGRSVAVFNLAEPLAADSAKLELLFERHYAASLGRFRVSVTTAGDAKARELSAEVEALLALPADELTGAGRAALLRYWSAVAPELKSARDEIETLRKQFPQDPTTLVMRERPADHPRPTFRHHRGEFLAPKEEVKPGVPAVLPPLPPLPKEAAPDRLTLARWLSSPQNPLTARVTVNRHWHALFGRGLVRTLDDFGYQGEAPTHPELLDWLAVEFRSGEKPWSVKHLHRLIVTSATYKQSSKVAPDLLARDAENRLLARGPRVRLEAEQVRDSALKAAGLLSAKMYGPSVFPPQPPGITTEGTYGGLNWLVSPGEDRYRRGLYTFAKRTAPYAMFGTFDAPSGEACTARREVSNTALQALTMLNDAVLIEASQALAKRVAAREGTTADRVAHLFRLCLVREPTVDEVASIGKFYEAQRERFAADARRASAVAGAGDNAAERAAWTATARAVLNLDEFITRE
ncbi:PSD1 and planctomycete cytochrome C domain-containing protein [Gemmata sp. JC673]|uniref:PSD1 and planctomycete cytochrome C domain-containing protein n=1 Tax=Gemmata algarum TaxID=2975278 RepID=A0ABU5F3N9_9BACT|nr:PSD1 and planctomycete cytochrome C domain-containing protein [Gemmata algarum]MDY3562180.1 PSD1 and planctomycete cytochrome C domain-containing protein [Gemmata algarum]